MLSHSDEISGSQTPCVDGPPPPRPRAGAGFRLLSDAAAAQELPVSRGQEVGLDLSGLHDCHPGSHTTVAAKGP